MGCCNEKPKITKNQEARKVELNLGFYNISSTTFYKVIRRHSDEFFILESNLRKAMNESKLDFIKLQPFFKNFIKQTTLITDEICYCRRKIATAGILLGNDENRKKVYCLFQNYKLEDEFLSEEDIKLMFDDISFIYLFAIPLFGMNKTNKNLKSEKYRKNIENTKKTLCNTILQIALKKDKRIALERFYEIFEHKIIVNVLDGNALRMLASELAKNNQDMPGFNKNNEELKDNLLLEQNSSN